MNSPARGNKYMLYLMFYKLFINFIFVASIITFNLNFNIITLIITSQILNFGIPFLVYKVITKQPFKEILLLKPISIKTILLIIVITFVIQPLMMFVSAISSLFVNNDVANIMQELTFFPLGLGILAIGITPSIFEEIIFRGALYTEYKNINIKKAALVNGLFFGIMHMNLQQFFYATFLGVVLTYLIYYTGSILAPMLSHFLLNSTQVILGYISFSAIANTPIEDTAEPNILLSIVFIGVTALLLLPLLSFLFKQLIEENTNNHSKTINIEKEGVNFIPHEGFNSYKINNWAFKGVIIYFVLYFVLGYLF